MFSPRCACPHANPSSPLVCIANRDRSAEVPKQNLIPNSAGRLRLNWSRVFFGVGNTCAFCAGSFAPWWNLVLSVVIGGIIDRSVPTAERARGEEDILVD